MTSFKAFISTGPASLLNYRTHIVHTHSNPQYTFGHYATLIVPPYTIKTPATKASPTAKATLKSPTAPIAPLFVEVAVKEEEEPTVREAGMVMCGLTTELGMKVTEAEVEPEGLAAVDVGGVCVTGTLEEPDGVALRVVVPVEDAEEHH